VLQTEPTTTKPDPCLPEPTTTKPDPCLPEPPRSTVRSFSKVLTAYDIGTFGELSVLQKEVNECFFVWHNVSLL